MKEHDENFRAQFELSVYGPLPREERLFQAVVCSPLVTKGTFIRYLRYYADMLEGKNPEQVTHILIPMETVEEDDE